jgi:hypothetical protein
MNKVSLLDSLYLSEYFRPFRTKLMCLIGDEHAKTGERINSTTSVPAYDRWRTILLREKMFYIMLDHLMVELLEEDLFDTATTNFPESFGNGSPEVVLDAIFQSSGYKGIEEYGEFLRKGSYFAICDENSKTLKIPLFRSMGKNEFSGGLLHLLKHFNVKGNAVTTGSQQHEFTLQTLLDMCETFFFEQGEVTDFKKRQIYSNLQFHKCRRKI